MFSLKIYMNLEENGESLVPSNQKNIIQEENLGTFVFNSEKVESNNSGISIREYSNIVKLILPWLSDLLISIFSK